MLVFEIHCSLPGVAVCARTFLEMCMFSSRSDCREAIGAHSKRSGNRTRATDLFVVLECQVGVYGQGKAPAPSLGLIERLFSQDRRIGVFSSCARSNASLPPCALCVLYEVLAVVSLCLVWSL